MIQDKHTHISAPINFQYESQGLTAGNKSAYKTIWSTRKQKKNVIKNTHAAFLRYEILKTQ